MLLCSPIRTFGLTTVLCQKQFVTTSRKLQRICSVNLSMPQFLQSHVQTLSQSSNYFDKSTSFVETSSLESGVQNKDSIVSTVKKYILMRRDYSKKYTANNTITAVRAMQEYILSPSDLDGLRQIKVRSPYESRLPIYVYLEKDVEKRAIQVHGSNEALDKERKRMHKLHRKQARQFNLFGEILATNKTPERIPKKLLTSGSGRVVAYAAVSNAIICVFKFGCFLTTRSASMFAEVLHSLADTVNQMLLLWGVNESLKKPDLQHPYGFGNMRHIVSLISGVGIFCMGSAASIYHGVVVLLQPTIGLDASTMSSFAVLTGAALIESGSLIVAVKETIKNAKEHELSFFDYIKDSRDPSTNVVLLEDSAAVLGLGLAAGALGLTMYTGNPLFDGVGSLAIGVLLGAVASFLVISNTNALIGRSIAQSRLAELQEMLEDDVVIRGVYDVKATQLNGDEFKFKAEIDFDGREITRAYLSTVEMEKVLKELSSVKTLEELESALLRHGEQVIDTLGAHVDRLESELKKKNPDLRHIDLEVL